ncbi:MAG: hypothetical protein J2P17_16950 [Mycobacterium sp.]|nr:hypothetical protein [Mycobacterium sp.]
MTFRWRILVNAISALRGPLPRPIRPIPSPWWESLSLPPGTMTVLTAQAAEYDTALERYVSAVLTDLAERGWHRTPPSHDRRGVVVPLAPRPRLPPIA